MNGGILDAIENMDDVQLAAAMSGYKLFGLSPVADLLSRTKDLLGKERPAPVEVQRYSGGDVVISCLSDDDELGELEPELDREYANYVPDDSALFARFEQYLRSNANDFADMHESETGGDNP
jgi:hypothetical protein